MKVKFVTQYATVVFDSMHCIKQEDNTGKDDARCRVFALQGGLKKLQVSTPGFVHIGTGEKFAFIKNTVLVAATAVEPGGILTLDGTPVPVPPPQNLVVELTEHDLFDPDDNLGQVVFTVEQLHQAYLSSGGTLVAHFSGSGASYEIYARVTNFSTEAQEAFLPPLFEQPAKGAKVVKTPADAKSLVSAMHAKILLAAGRTAISDGFDFGRTPWHVLSGPSGPENQQKLSEELQFIWSRAFEFPAGSMSLVGHSRFQPWTCVGAALALLFQRAPMRFLNIVKQVVADGTFSTASGKPFEVDSSFFTSLMPTATEFNAMLGDPDCTDYAEFGVHRPQGEFLNSTELIRLDFDFDLAQWMLLGLLVGGAKSWMLGAFSPQTTNFSADGSVLNAGELHDLCARLHNAYVTKHEFDDSKTGLPQWKAFAHEFMKFGPGNVLLGIQAAQFEGKTPQLCALIVTDVGPWKIPPVSGPIYHLQGAALHTTNATKPPYNKNFLGDSFNATVPDGKVRQDVIVGLVHSIKKLNPFAWEVTWQIHGDFVTFRMTKEVVESGGYRFGVFVGPDG